MNRTTDDDPVLYRLRRFEFARNASFWLPVYFLLFDAELPASDALLLVAVYYLAGVLFEVPSGWLSDRIGRRRILVAAGALQLFGALLIGLSSNFAGFAVGQACLAAAVAFVSGSDTSLLYEHLRAVGATDRIPDEEARLQRAGLLGLSGSALVGGLLGVLHLRLPYLAAAVASAYAIHQALQLVDPPRGARREQRPETDWLAFVLEDWVLIWCFGLGVVAMVFNHVPLELLQPYLAALELPSASTPLAAGAILGGTMWIAVGTSRLAPTLGRRLGPANGALAGMAVQGLVIGLLALAVHPVLAAALLLRSVPQSLVRPLMHALMHPRLRDDFRATWFSVQSLAGQLALAGALAVAARPDAGHADLGGDQVLMLLRVAFLGLAVSLVILWVGSPRVPGSSYARAHPETLPHETT